MGFGKSFAKILGAAKVPENLLRHQTMDITFTADAMPGDLMQLLSLPANSRLVKFGFLLLGTVNSSEWGAINFDCKLGTVTDHSAIRSTISELGALISVADDLNLPFPDGAQFVMEHNLDTTAFYGEFTERLIGQKIRHYVQYIIES